MSDSIDPIAVVRSCSPTFAGISESDRGSMPIGNGELCANVWVESDGVHFYLARSDALTELDRTVKLGEFVVGLSPNPFEDAASVTQSLDMVSGSIRISVESKHESTSIAFFIDTARDDAFVRVESSIEREVWAEIRHWRTAPNPITEAAVGMFWGDEDSGRAPELAAIVESADVLTTIGDGVMIYHLNGPTIVPHIIALHELESIADDVPDLLSNRCFGTVITSPSSAGIRGPRVTSHSERIVDLRFSTFSTQNWDPDDLAEAADASRCDVAAARTRTAEHWTRYWNTSWIVVTGDAPRTAKATPAVREAATHEGLPRVVPTTVSPVTQAYVLTKWMTACGSSGTLPIRYNGGLFTTMPGAGMHLELENFGLAFTAAPAGAPTVAVNPDERSWTIEQLWQNIRLPYYGLLSQGDADALLPLFAYYRRFWEVDRARARLHYGARGQWNTEMTLTCGLQAPGTYGLDRSDVPVGYAKNRWGGAINLSPGLELCSLQFDYWRFTGDDVFLIDQVIPYAHDLIDFALSYYLDAGSTMLRFEPLNSLETYFDTTNPVAVVAGYRRLALDLRSVPEALTGDRARLEELEAALPPIPLEQWDNVSVVAPAEVYEPVRRNVESPELYCVYPFDLRESLGLPVLRRTWDRCQQVSGALRPRVIGEWVGEPTYAGWQYLGPVAAMLGLVDVAADVLMENAALTNPGHAFPAMWGPVYDSVPDTDHGANIINTLQLIVDEAIANPEARRGLPAEWRVDFRVYRSDGTPIEGTMTRDSLQLAKT